MLKSQSLLKILWVLGLFILLMACSDNESSSDEQTDQDNQIEEGNQNEDDSESGAEENKEEESESVDSLPEAIPSDFPFPDDASFTINVLEQSGATSYIVGFSTSEDPEEIYKTYRDYVTNKGFSIVHEDQDNFNIKSMNDSLEGIGFEISDMGSVKVVTVTFTIPLE